jgi:hypothetical protein
VYIKSLFKKPEPAMAGAGGGGVAPGKEEQENVIVKGLKTVVDTADGILGAGLPDTEELRRQKQGPPPEVRLSFCTHDYAIYTCWNAIWFSLLHTVRVISKGGHHPTNPKTWVES